MQTGSQRAGAAKARLVGNGQQLKIDNESIAALCAAACRICERLVAAGDPFEGRIELLRDVLRGEIRNFPLNVFEFVTEPASRTGHYALAVRLRDGLDGHLAARAFDRLGISRH